MNRILLFLLLPGCVTLDPLLPFHSNIPCTDVDESTCEDEDDVWDKVCTPCEDYPSGPWWTEDYDWRAQTLDTLILGTSCSRVSDPYTRSIENMRQCRA